MAKTDQELLQEMSKNVKKIDKELGNTEVVASEVVDALLRNFVLWADIYENQRIMTTTIQKILVDDTPLATLVNIQKHIFLKMGMAVLEEDEYNITFISYVAEKDMYSIWSFNKEAKAIVLMTVLPVAALTKLLDKTHVVGEITADLKQCTNAIAKSLVADEGYKLANVTTLGHAKNYNFVRLDEIGKEKHLVFADLKTSSDKYNRSWGGSISVNSIVEYNNKRLGIKK